MAVPPNQTIQPDTPQKTKTPEERDKELKALIWPLDKLIHGLQPKELKESTTNALVTDTTGLPR